MSEARLRAAETGVVAGLIAGVVTLAAARVAMRVLAMAGGSSDFFPSMVFTLDGTFAVVIEALAAIPLGFAFVALRHWLPRPGWRAGLAYGVALLLALGVPFLLGNGEFQGDRPNAGLGRVLFAPLFLLFGVVLGTVAAWLERRRDDGYRPGRWSSAAFAALFFSTVPVMFFTDLAPLTPDRPPDVFSVIRATVFIALGGVALAARARLDRRQSSRLWGGILLGMAALLTLIGLGVTVVELREIRVNFIDPRNVVVVPLSLLAAVAVVALSGRLAARWRARTL